MNRAKLKQDLKDMAAQANRLIKAIPAALEVKHSNKQTKEQLSSELKRDSGLGLATKSLAFITLLSSMDMMAQKPMVYAPNEEKIEIAPTPQASHSSEPYITFEEAGTIAQNAKTTGSTTENPATTQPEISEDTKDFYIGLQILKYRELHPNASEVALSAHKTAIKNDIARHPDLAINMQTQLDKIAEADILNNLTDEQEAAIDFMAAQRMAEYKEVYPDALPEELVAVYNRTKMDILTPPNETNRITQAETEYNTFIANCQAQGLLTKDGDLTDELDTIASNNYDTIFDQEMEKAPSIDKITTNTETKQTEVEQLYPPVERQKMFHIENKGSEILDKLPHYDTAEIRKVIKPDGSSVEWATINGQKHGAEIERDKNGKVTGLKLYDHGNEMDLSKTNSTIDFQEEEVKGIRRTVVLLDGKPFGTEIATNTLDGSTKAAFYENGGRLINGSPSAQISQINETQTQTLQQYVDVTKCYSYIHREELETMCKIQAIRNQTKELQQQKTSQQNNTPSIAMYTATQKE